MIDLSRFNYLNEGQLQIVQEAYNWYHYSSDLSFQFEGPPGTGKSVVLMAIAMLLDPSGAISRAAAYTGAAAIVMRKKGFTNASTLHSLLYQPVEQVATDDDGRPIEHKYFDTPVYELGFIPKYDGTIKLLFCDESGMIPGYMRREIESRGIRVVACGDLRQLPTVDDEPGYLREFDKIYHLTQIMRQEANNAIIWLSERAYKGLPIHEGNYGNVLVIEEDQLTDRMILGADVVLCGKNETRDNINTRIRKEILHTDNPLPQMGEKLVCRKNNWMRDVDGISLANGLIGYSASYMDPTRFDGKIFRIDFIPNIANVLFHDLLVDYNYFTAPYYLRQKIKNNKYSIGEKMEFAYAITTHLSQGSEWRCGIYMQEYLHKDINNHLDFVGLTRFKQYAIFVKQKRKFYTNGNNFNK